MSVAWAGRRHRGRPHRDPAAGDPNLRTMTGRRAMSHVPAQVAGSVIYAEGLTRDFGSWPEARAEARTAAAAAISRRRGWLPPPQPPATPPHPHLPPPLAPLPPPP